MIRLHLPDITLVCYEAKAFHLATIAVSDIKDKIAFGGVKGFFDQQNLSKDEGQKWLWEVMPKSIQTSHVLNVEWDSGINDLTMWTNEFLHYDFTGAPWPWHESHERVGNGGFSLVSRRLLEALTDFPYAFPWDDTLCRRHRPDLEARGFHWAPEALAAKFSLEHGPIRRSFGFHDCRNFPRILSLADLARRLDSADDYVRNHPSWKEMLNYPTLQEIANLTPR
jgi:hypothetical protein